MSFTRTRSRNSWVSLVAVLKCLLLLFSGVQICAATVDPLKLQEEQIEKRKTNVHRKKMAAQGVQYISAYEARAKFEAGKLLLLDVNSKGFYECEHMLGAIHWNIDKARIRFPRHVEIGIYCR